MNQTNSILHTASQNMMYVCFSLFIVLGILLLSFSLIRFLVTTHDYYARNRAITNLFVGFFVFGLGSLGLCFTGAISDTNDEATVVAQETTTNTSQSSKIDVPSSSEILQSIEAEKEEEYVLNEKGLEEACSSVYKKSSIYIEKEKRFANLTDDGYFDDDTNCVFYLDEGVSGVIYRFKDFEVNNKKSPKITFAESTKKWYTIKDDGSIGDCLDNVPDYFWHIDTNDFIDQLIH